MDRRKFLQASGTASAFLLLQNQLFAASLSGKGQHSAIKPIAGSWFEFVHGFAPEGKYWNPALPEFTTEQWKAKVKEQSEIGIEYLVLMAIANDGKTFYPSKLQPRYDYACADPLEAILSAADECGIKFFVSNDFWADWREGAKMMTSSEVAALREKGMEEVAEKYSHHKSFYGWYYPNESGLWNTIDDTTINYVNRCTRKAKELTSQFSQPDCSIWHKIGQGR